MNWYDRHGWWVLRTLRLPLDIFLFATLAFFLIRMLPGDPVSVALATRSDPVTPELIATLRSEMGLDGSLWAQLGRFWTGLLHGDFGKSLETGIPVTHEVLDRLPATVEIILLGLGGAFALTMVLGFCYLRFSSDLLRRTIRLIASFATSVPVFVVAIFGIVVFYVLLSWFPAPLGRTAGGQLPVFTGFPLLDEVLTGRIDLLLQTLVRYVLPVGAMVLTYTPNLLTQFVGGLDREIDQTTTRFQVAAGARRRWVYFSVMRRSVSSVVVIFGLFFGSLIGGAVTIESLFGFGGLGQLGIRSVNTVDFPALQGFLVLIVAFCLVMFLVVDLVNMWLDPRRRPGVASEGK